MYGEFQGPLVGWLLGYFNQTYIKKFQLFVGIPSIWSRTVTNLYQNFIVSLGVLNRFFCTYKGSIPSLTPRIALNFGKR